MPDSISDEVTRCIKRLTVAVWVLILIVTLNLLVSLFAALFPPVVAKRIAAISPEFTSERAGQYNDFHNWALEKQIQTASVIALGKMKLEGDTYKCIITEILKQNPHTLFYYKAGDEFRHASHAARPGTEYGEGQILFFTGSPAEFRLSMGFSGDRIAGLGDMPLETLRKMISEQSR